MGHILSPQLAAFVSDMIAAGYLPASGTAGQVVDVATYEDIPAPSAATTGQEYQVANASAGSAGGTRWKSNGVSLVKQSPGVGEGNGSSILWSARVNGSTIGQRQQFNLGGSNNPCYDAFWNGTRWAPVGEQIVFDLAAPIVSASNVTQTCTFPNININGGLMGLSGTLRMRVGWELAAGTPLTRVLDSTWDGSAMVTETGVLHRRLGFTRTIINQNNAAIQQILERAGDYTTDGSVNTTGQGKTKNTANDLVIAGSIVSTYGSATTAQIHRLRMTCSGYGV